MSKIILYGIGSDLYNFIKLDRQEKPYIFNDEIAAYTDSCEEKWGALIEGIEVLPPSEALCRSYDYVVISSSRYICEIKKYLIEKFGISQRVIVGLERYRINKICEYQVCENNKHIHPDVSFMKFDTTSLVVYTAIFGNYDSLADPVNTNKNFDYVAFTDNPQLRSDIWNIELVKKDDEPAIQARKYKVLPHKYFKDYHTSIWIDGNMRIQDDFADMLKDWQISSDMLLIPHPHRNCIYEEGGACMVENKDKKSTILKQLFHYLEEGCPESNGLPCGGFMVRNHNEDAVVKVMEDWWRQIMLFSKRDQISLPYVCWKNHFHYDLCNCYIYENKWFHGDRHIL